MGESGFEGTRMPANCVDARGVDRCDGGCIHRDDEARANMFAVCGWLLRETRSRLTLAASCSALLCSALLSCRVRAGNAGKAGRAVTPMQILPVPEYADTAGNPETRRRRCTGSIPPGCPSRLASPPGPGLWADVETGCETGSPPPGPNGRRPPVRT